MPILDIIEYPDPVLRQTASPIAEIDLWTDTLINNLVDTLHSTTGVGLCAPQLGHSVQLLAMDLSERQNDTEVFINPRIVAKAGFAVVQEQCLSIPGVAASVLRAGVIQINALDEHGKEFEREYEGMKAVCLQHEIDHLQGKLFIDRISRLRRFRFRKTLDALENNSAAAMLQHC